MELGSDVINVEFLPEGSVIFEYILELDMKLSKIKNLYENCISAYFKLVKEKITIVADKITRNKKTRISMLLSKKQDLEGISMENVFRFKSDDNIPYIFDNNTGIIYEDITDFKTEDGEMNLYNAQYFKNLEGYLSNFRRAITHNITKSEIQKYYNEAGFTELIFKMTDACNMRCSYCIYSEHYPDTLTYGNDYISAEIVKKAIDEYMGHINRIKKNIPNKIPFIAFYGGEPLLAYDVIKEAIEYVEDKYSDMNTQYTITTNGIILKNKNICNYLKSKNVIICLSIDGYKENHDRNRLLIGKKPSYEQIINIIKENFLDYENIYSLCCIDTKTDLEKLYEFYKNNDRMSGGIVPHVLRFSYIYDQSSNYYDQFTEDEKKIFHHQLNNLRQKYISSCINENYDWILELLIGQEFIQLIDRVKFSSTVNFYKKNGCCVPGEKIYVYQDGGYGICEKVCYDDIDLGNVFTGLDIEKVVNQMKKFDDVAYNKCKNCEVSSICNLCYVNLNNNGKLNLEENFCEKKKEYFALLFKTIIYIEQKNPGFWGRKISKQAEKNLSYVGKLQNLINL